MTKLGRELKDLDLSPIGMHDTKDIRKLVKTEGMVGVMEKDGEIGLLLETSPSLHVDDTRPSLGLGGPGVITPNMTAASKQMQRVRKV
jgi:hypothetical protein